MIIEVAIEVIQEIGIILVIIGVLAAIACYVNDPESDIKWDDIS